MKKFLAPFKTSASIAIASSGTQLFPIPRPFFGHGGDNNMVWYNEPSTGKLEGIVLSVDFYDGIDHYYTIVIQDILFCNIPQSHLRARYRFGI